MLIRCLAVLTTATLLAATASAEQKKVAVFELKGAITEKPAAIDDPFATTTSQESCTSITQRMRKAAEDDEVVAVAILCESPQMGWAQSEEIHRAIAEIRAAKKPVYTHDDAYTTAEYAMLSSASMLTTSPEGSVLIPGLYGEQPYLRGLLDKIEVEPDFIALGDYKAAGEMFMRREPSDAARENQKWLYDSLFASIVDAIAAGRGVEADKARAWIDEAVFSASEAKADGVLDAALTKDELADRIEKDLDTDLDFDKSYGKPKKKTIDLSSPFGLLNFYADLLAGPSTKKSTKDTIAIVHVNGAIQDGEPNNSPFSIGGNGGAYSGPIRRALDQAADDAKVRAVVLRVDSPGGSATASEVILQAAQRVSEKKPLIVSMGNVAASGGYYVSMAGETIFVDEKTITGSIGVVSGKLATGEMWENLGINFVPVERGKNAGLFSTSTTFTDEQKEQMLDFMRDVYGTFKGHVEANRGDKLSKPVDELAGGRVYSGRQAIELGLADEVGTIHDAVEAARAAAKMGEDFDLKVIPRPKNFLELLAADLSPTKDEKGPRLSLLEIAEPLLGTLDPNRAAAVRQALQQADIVRTNRIGLISPIFVQPQ